MLHEPVVREIFNDLSGGTVDLAAGNPFEDLPHVLIHLLGADVETPVGESDRPIGEQRQHGRAFIGHIHGMRRQRVRGRGESGNGPIFHDFGFAGLRVQAHGPASGQQKQLAFLRQRHQFIGTGQAPFLAPAAQKQKIRMIIDIPLLVSDKHMGADGGRCHM